MIEKILPQNIDAECGVLGSLIIDPEAILEVLEFLRVEHFYRDAHRVIYETILWFANKQQPADFITLSDELERRNKLEMVGGVSYITSLVSRVPSSGNIEYYARIVERAAQMRMLIAAAGEIADAAYREEDGSVDLAERRIFQIREGTAGKPVSTHVDALTRYMINLNDLHEQKSNGGITGVPTPFPLLTSLIGGWRPSRYHILAARPSDGKSAMALNFAVKAVKSGCNVYYCSQEMNEEEIMERLLAQEAGVNSQRLRDGSLSDIQDTFGYTDWDRVVEAEARLRELQNHLFIDDTPGMTHLGIASKARRLHAAHRLDLIIVDYLQLVSVEEDRKIDRRLAVEEVSRSFQRLARELKVPVLALAQLNREVESRADRMPRKEDLRETGGIENDADIIMLIYKSAEIPVDATEYDVSLIVDKHRNGAKGSIPLHFVGPFTKFYPLKKEVQQ